MMEDLKWYQLISLVAFVSACAAILPQLLKVIFRAIGDVLAFLLIMICPTKFDRWMKSYRNYVNTIRKPEIMEVENV